MKIVQWIVVALIFFGLGWFAHERRADIPFLNQPASQEESETPEVEETGQPCIQVITPAVNPETGEIKEFPTPCDVPEGWEKIENDVPGLDLEIQ